jgi:hypothetical protein
MIADCPISETNAQTQTSAQVQSLGLFRFSEKSDFSRRPQLVVENTGPQIGFIDPDGVFYAQRSALPMRQTVVSRRADKYRVRCALSVFIRFHPSPVLDLSGASV